MPRKIKTASERACDLRKRYPDMPVTEIVSRTGLARSGVYAALKSGAPGRGAGGGRPRKDAGTVACPHCEGTGRVKHSDALRNGLATLLGGGVIAGVNDAGRSKT